MTDAIDAGAVLDNPDRAMICALVSERRSNVPLRMNRVLEALSAKFVRGEPGDVEIGFSALADSVQGNGVVAGGTLTTMVDYGMAFAVLSKLPPGRTCATISLTVNMQSPAMIGNYIVEARASRVGSRVAFVRAELINADRTRLIADATASFAVLNVHR